MNKPQLLHPISLYGVWLLGDIFLEQNAFWVPKKARWNYIQENAKQPNVESPNEEYEAEEYLKRKLEPDEEAPF